MRKKLGKSSLKSGLPPGTLVHIGESAGGKTRISLVDYSEENIVEKEITSISEAVPYRDTESVTWININGVQDLSVVEDVGRQFCIHPLLLEDIVSTEQRPKLEDYGEFVFIVLKRLGYDEENYEVTVEQISIILGENLLISFQESEDFLAPLRERIKIGKGRMRKMGADYLAYSIMDAVVDSYFIILEKLGERIEMMEDQLVAEPDRATLKEIHKLKQEMVFLRRSVWPLREVIGALERGESTLVTLSASVYLRDLYDHTVQAIETTEAYRDILGGMLDIYLSSVSNRMNEVMKVLTIIATIFMPLSFFAGVYGMNFEHFPEITWRYGYLFFWLIIIIVFSTMLLYFRRRKWL
jgi:magnesium transporter